MAKLKDKIQTTLDEGRMLVLGSQVLLGFQFRSAFEKGFEQLPVYARDLKMGGLALMCVALAVLMAPSAYHRIVEKGEDTEELQRYASWLMDIALLPFALALGIDFFVAIEKVAGRTWGITAGLATLAVALFFWYGLEIVRRREREPQIEEKQEMSEKEEGSQEGGTKTKDKIQHVLTEARVVLPGAQALLGFQFVTFLMESFDKLPESSKYVHAASITFVALSIVLLMTPAAYHRIVEKGEETEHFHRFASRMLIAAMVTLPLGIAGDLFVVMRKVTESGAAGLAAASVMLVVFYGLWFAYTLYRRGQEETSHRWQVDFNKQQAGD